MTTGFNKFLQLFSNRRQSNRNYVTCIAGAGLFIGRNYEDARAGRSHEGRGVLFSRASSKFRPINKPATATQARNYESPRIGGIRGACVDLSFFKHCFFGGMLL